MSTPPVHTRIGSPDDWPFWELVYSDPELVSWDLSDTVALSGPASAAGAGPALVEEGTGDVGTTTPENS